jgi:hypothetical protein
MNASEQATRAPLSFRCARRELSANDETFCFELQQSRVDFQLVEIGRVDQLLNSYWPQSFESSTNDLDEGIFSSPHHARDTLRRDNRRLELCVWVIRLELWQTFGCNPQFFMWSYSHHCSTTVGIQLCEELLPA